MKNAVIISFVIMLAGCGGKGKPSSGYSARANATTRKTLNKGVKFAPYPLNVDYTVIDTGKYENEGPMGGGRYAIVQKDGLLVDTIDLFYGMKFLADRTYLYRKLTGEPRSARSQSTHTLELEEGNYLLINNRSKTVLKNLVPNLDEYYSSPNAINGKIYFWQLEKADTIGTSKVSAAEFDLSTHKTKSFFLLNDMIETDDSNYFPLPYLKNGTIIFTMDGEKKWKFSADFKAL